MFYYNYYKKLFKTYGKVFLKKNNIEKGNRKYLDIGIINPSIGTSNLGDLIILDAVLAELRNHYPQDLFTNFPSQLGTDFMAKELMGKKDCLFVSGTNLLMSNMNKHSQWKIDPGHKIFLRNKVILTGVGWWQYQNKPNSYTQDLYKTILSENSYQSVRDSYTAEMLKSIGIENVVNTTCPTLWNVTPEHCQKVPVHKSPKVVTTMTFYKANAEKDRLLLDMLVDNYEKTYLWVQGLEDIEYMKKIFPRYNKVELVAPTMEAYNDILMDPEIEYLGTRLHAGIRALQYGKRTQIVAVDNRAIEIGKDTNLNVISRDNVEQALDFIQDKYVTKVVLPIDNINKWRQALPKLK